MRGLKGIGPLIAVALLGLAGLILAEPIARWIGEHNAFHPATAIGHVVEAQGSLKRVHGGDVEVVNTPLEHPVELHDGDRLQTGPEGHVIFVLNSQDEFEMAKSSALQLQLWNPMDPSSAIYVVSTVGELELRKAGVRGKAYVVKDGRLYLPGQKPLQKPMALTVLKSAPLDLHLGTGSNSAPPEFDPDKGADGTAGMSAEADPETLSNEYIDDTIVAQQALLQKCWLTRLKDAPGLKGQIVVQFEISKRGRVKEARIADSTLEDDVLKKCVLSVIERIVFRAFKGSEIALSYPIHFE